jgi:hypothetical protein
MTLTLTAKTQKVSRPHEPSPTRTHSVASGPDKVNRRPRISGRKACGWCPGAGRPRNWLCFARCRLLQGVLVTAVLNSTWPPGGRPLQAEIGFVSHNPPDCPLMPSACSPMPDPIKLALFRATRRAAIRRMPGGRRPSPVGRVRAGFVPMEAFRLSWLVSPVVISPDGCNGHPPVIRSLSLYRHHTMAMLVCQWKSGEFLSGGPGIRGTAARTFRRIAVCRAEVSVGGWRCRGGRWHSSRRHRVGRRFY